MRQVPITVVCSLALVALVVYLFVHAPVPLPEESARVGRTVPIETALAIVAAENDVARALYTRDIVGPGKAAGLAFDEHWRDPKLEAGPLPALFLREAAMSLEKDPVRLSLFLGSDFPISPSNLFSGQQDEAFKSIRQTGQPQFFFAADTGLFTAMFPDLASVQACVDCHNDHPQSPKTDWVLNDIMGATTWAYPAEEVTVEELIEVLAALRRAFGDAYDAFLAKAQTYSRQPEIGERWPRDGYYLPSRQVFLDEFARRASAQTVARLLEAGDVPQP